MFLLNIEIGSDLCMHVYFQTSNEWQMKKTVDYHYFTSPLYFRHLELIVIHNISRLQKNKVVSDQSGLRGDGKVAAIL